MRRLLPREKKIIAGGLLVVSLALVWAALINPVVQGFVHRSAERRQLLATYDRNQRVLGGMRVFGADARSQRSSQRRYAITAASSALGSSYLKERVGRVLVQQGGALKAVQDMPADVRTGELRVRVDAQLSTQQLYEAVRRLQTEEPYVVIEYLSASVDPISSGAKVDPMDVRLEVSGRFHPAEAGPR